MNHNLSNNETLGKFIKESDFSVDEWIKKQWYIYTMEYYRTGRKKEFLPFVTAWIELQTHMLSEISQSMKDKYHMISLIRGI